MSRTRNIEDNKTEAVRRLFKQFPVDMTPAEIWEHLKIKIPKRVHIYPILKHLKDRGDIIETNGRYSLPNKFRESSI
jgi:hypothetical protein